MLHFFNDRKAIPNDADLSIVNLIVVIALDRVLESFRNRFVPCEGIRSHQGLQVLQRPERSGHDDQRV